MLHSILSFLSIRDEWKQKVDSLLLTKEQSLNLLLYSDLGHIIYPNDWSILSSITKPGSTKTITYLQQDCLVQLVDYLDIGHSISQQIDELDQENQRHLVQCEDDEQSQSASNNCNFKSDINKHFKFWFSQGFINSSNEPITIPLVCISNSLAIPLIPGLKVLLRSGIPIRYGVLFPTEIQFQVLGGGWINTELNSLVEFKRNERLEMLKTRQHKKSQDTITATVCIDID